MATATADNDELQMKVEAKLTNMNIDDLKHVAKAIGILETTYENKSALGVLKIIRKFMDFQADVDAEQHKQDLEMVDAAVATQLKKTGVPITITSVTTPVATSSSTGTVTTITASVTTPLLMTADSTPSSSMSTTTSSVVGGGIGASMGIGNLLSLRRELKITGQIGDPGQRDKLTFVSVHNQIKEAEQRGLSEREIIGAVIRAMTPSLPLRRFLEATSVDNVTLSLLKKYLRSHYHEKSAQELYAELDGITQRAGEDAMSFLFRSFKLEAKIILAAEAEARGSFASKYPEMVRGLTLQTIETGLAPGHEGVRIQIRPFLKTPGMTADELASQLRIIMAAEKSRDAKMSAAASAAAGHQPPKRRPANAQVNAIVKSESTDIASALQQLQV